MPNSAKDIFLTAADIDDPPARAGYLDQACGVDANLRRRVEALLRAQTDPDSLLDHPAVADQAALAGEGTQALDSSGNDASSSSSEETIAGGGKSGDESLEYLTPSERPDALGRLDHYEVLEVIGKGGFGIVLRGFDDRLHRMVAIKVLSPAFAANGSARRRFIREAQAVAAVKNEHVVAIHDVQENANPPYLVMEIIDGISLQDKIDKQGARGVKEILRIGMQIAEGLSAAHKQGLVHRDIKPSNILLENGVERVKITDFGLARAVDDASVTQSGTVAGTPMYMSPEQAEGLPIDHRSDLFSLGTVLYAMCTGHPPFRASGTHAVLKRVIDASPRPIREINNEIPDWLEAIIAKLHAKKPEDRFPTAKEVAELLGQHLAHLQQPSVAPQPAPVGIAAATPASDGKYVLPVLSALGLGFRTYCVFVVIVGALLWLGMWLFGWRTMTVVRILFPLFVLFGIASWGLAAWATRSHRPRWGAAFRQTAVTLGLFAFGLGVATLYDWISPLPEPIEVVGGVRTVTVVLGGPTDLDLVEVIIRSVEIVDEKVRPDGRHGAVLKQEAAFVMKKTTSQAELPPGLYQAEVVCRPGAVLRTWDITRDQPGLNIVASNMNPMIVDLKAGERVLIQATLEKAEKGQGWVQLFNGTNLKGWKKHPDAPAPWTVENNILKGSGAKGWLFTEHGDFQNFHLRAVVKINGGADSNISFRAPFEVGKAGPKLDFFAVPNCYLCFLHKCVRLGARPTPSIGRAGPLSAGFPAALFIVQDDSLIRPEEWFTLDIIADGNRFIAKINGKEAVKCTDPLHAYSKGHIALGVFSEATVVQYKKIEIKELPPTSAPPPPDEKQKLQGTWTAIDFEENGNVNKDALKLIDWTFSVQGEYARLKSVSGVTGQAVTVVDVEGVFLPDSSVTPKRFRLIMSTVDQKEGQLIGIYELQQDRLRLCYQSFESAADYPTAFATRPASPLKLLTFKRQPGN